jgi:uncharacterized protein with gpF-like domain
MPTEHKDTRGALPPAAFRYAAAWDIAPQSATRRRFIKLKVTRPNAGVEEAYRKKLIQLLIEMEKSVLWWVKATYRANPPKMAVDDFASVTLARALRELKKRWAAQFDKFAKRYARYFAISTAKRTDEQLRRILREGGFSVKWNMTPGQKDVLEAIVAENVALIRSIPQESLARVEGAVMRSVQTGRDLKSLTDDLVKGFQISKKRARFIARDQNNKASSMLQRVRFVENGITECMWMHSSAGKTPRPSHVKAGRDKVKFDPRFGWYDPHLEKYIWPGTEPNCRCTMRPIIRGFE